MAGNDKKGICNKHNIGYGGLHINECPVCKKEDGDTINIQVDLTQVKENIKKYVERKIKQEIKSYVEDELPSDMTWEMDKVNWGELGERVEKLEDWKREIQQGWINPDGTNKR